MTKTLTFKYEGETVVLEDKTESCMCLRFENPTWRVEITNRDIQDFELRLTHWDLSGNDETGSHIIFDYACSCYIHLLSIELAFVEQLPSWERLDKETTSTVVSPIIKQIVKQLKRELRDPFKDQEYLEKWTKQFKRWMEKPCNE